MFSLQRGDQVFSWPPGVEGNTPRLMAKQYKLILDILSEQKGYFSPGCKLTYNCLAFLKILWHFLSFFSKLRSFIIFNVTLTKEHNPEKDH